MVVVATVALRGRAYPLMALVPSFLTWRHLCFHSFYNGCLGFLSQALETESASSPIPGSKVLETFRKEFEIGSCTMSIKTSKIVKFANGSIVITMDKTNMLSSGVPPVLELGAPPRTMRWWWGKEWVASEGEGKRMMASGAPA